jgi:hypothetical protein
MEATRMHHIGIPETFQSDHPAEWGSVQATPADQSATPTNLTIGQPIRVVNLNGQLRGTRMMTIAAYALPVIDPAVPTLPIVAGPIIGILNFSGGGGGGTIEFDIPMNRSGVPSNGDVAGISPGGGAIVSVPAQSVQLSVRNDANLAPNFGTVGAAAIGQKGFAPKVQGFAGYGTKTGRLTRTVWMACGSPGFGAGVVSSLASVPPYARSFRVLRDQTVTADTIVVSIFGPPAPGAGSLLEQVSIAGGAPSPEFVLGPAAVVGMTFPGTNAGLLRKCAYVFNIENGGGA